MSSATQTEDVYKKFNQAVKELLKDLMRNFPAVKELKFVYAGYKLIKSFGKKLVQRNWDEAVGKPYGEHIRMKNDLFFMEPDFDLPKSYRFYSNYIPIFQAVWRSLDQSNKEAIWQHLQVVMYLSQECMDYKHRTKQQQPVSLEEDESEKEFKACCKELHVEVE